LGLVGGIGHVAAYLAELDLSSFDAKAPPPKTPAFWDVVGASSAPEDAELGDVLEALGKPKAITIAKLIEKAAAMGSDTAEWLMDRRQRRSTPHRMERCGYTQVRNPNSDDGRWTLNGKNMIVYAKTELSSHERFTAVKELQA
jgi:hypothetical protein